MKKLFGMLIAAVVVVGLSSSSALAIKPFNDEWVVKYNIKTPKTAAEMSLAAAAETTKCNICHVAGKTSKKERNAYGLALSKLLKKEDFSADRRETEPDKVKAEINAAFDAVAKEKSPSGKTFGELINAGKLPGE